MKMDSYRRFVRSPLYQRCTLASVEGKLLPPSDRMGSWEDVANRSSSFGVTPNSNTLPGGKSEQRHQKRGSLGGSVCLAGGPRARTICLRVPPVTLSHNSSVVLSSFFVTLDNQRRIHQQHASLQKRSASADEVEQQCGAWLPLQADGGQYGWDCRV